MTIENRKMAVKERCLANRVTVEKRFYCIKIFLQVRSQLVEQIEAVQVESSKLQAANSELQRQRDNLEDEKEDVIKDKDRQIKENERW